MHHFVSSRLITVAEEQINLVKQERAHYWQGYKTSCDKVKASFPVVPPPSCMLLGNSTDTTVHYSFDMAQQVLIDGKKITSIVLHYSHNLFQPGPIYFLTPRKCTIFGMHCEAIPQQVTKCNMDHYYDPPQRVAIISIQRSHIVQCHGKPALNKISLIS